MTDARFTRTELLLGPSAMERLTSSHVAVFGVGGVGGYVVEALARSAVGALDIVDADDVDVTNINRQIIATTATVGRPKVEVMAERIHDINPACKVVAHRCFFLPENADTFDFGAYDYVVDAVDTVSAKLAIIERAHDAGVPVISSMGAGRKLDPAAFEVADVFETSIDPLAKVMRRELRKRGIDALKVVYSKEPAKTMAPVGDETDADGDAGEAADAPANGRRGRPARRPTTPSCAFVPPVVGLIIASEVVKDLVGGAGADSAGLSDNLR